MRVDVSEIKTFRACKRQWQLSSRNRFHLRPIVTPPAFAFGTIFHEALAELYLGASLEKVMTMVRREMSTDNDAALLAMIPGYYEKVLPYDLDVYKVLDIEHHFNIAPCTSDGEYMLPMVHKVNKETGEIEHDEFGAPILEPILTICGSIDMIALDTITNEIWGFEHKTCKSFRDGAYLWLDEQPRVYTWALKQYVDEYNKAHRNDEGFVPAKLGGVYLNEVKKLLRNFQYQRTACQYSDEDLDMFMEAFFATCMQCIDYTLGEKYAAPQPSYFACQMCNFKTICQTYMYENLSKDAVLKEFEEEFVERTEDHLDEKSERSAE